MSWEPKKTAVPALGLPRDMILRDALIDFVGRSQVNVKNYGSILIYMDTLIKFQTRNCRVVIHGARLKVDCYIVEEMKVIGQIGSLEFEMQVKGETRLIKWLLHNWEGYVRLRPHDYSPERSLNLCNARDLEIWGLICNRDEDYEFSVTVEGYHRVKSLVRKTQVRLHIAGRHGLPLFIYRHRKRWYYGVGVMTFFIVLYIMSLFIRGIQFEDNYRYTYDALIRFLDTQDIDYGMLKARVNCEDLKAPIHTSFPETTWVFARVSGTRPLIHTRENKVLSTIPEKNETPCDIMTSQPGIITSMIVRQGVAQVYVGDEVEEGQVLISGRVPIIGDNEEEVDAYMVRADADIVARTVKQYEKTFPLLHQERVHARRRWRG